MSAYQEIENVIGKERNQANCGAGCSSKYKVIRNWKKTKIFFSRIHSSPAKGGNIRVIVIPLSYCDCIDPIMRLVLLWLLIFVAMVPGNSHYELLLSLYYCSLLLDIVSLSNSSHIQSGWKTALECRRPYNFFI